MKTRNKKLNRILKRVLITLLVVVAGILIFQYRYSFFNFSNKSRDQKVEQTEDTMTNKNNLSGSEDTVLVGKVKTPGALRIMSLINFRDNVTLSKDNIIKITNDYRTEKGNLPLLTENAKLKLSAEKKLQDMFTNQYFEHVSPTGIDIEKLGLDVGYKYVLIGENLAMGNFKDDKSLVGAWMNSIGHRENILNKNYKEIGVAVGKGMFEGKEVWIAVQHFGTPRSVCPSINESIYEEINSKQTEINSLEKDLNERIKVIEREVKPYEGGSKDYLKKVEEYNNIIIYYNDLIDQTKTKIETYNEQVRDFNLCLIEYQ